MPDLWGQLAFVAPIIKHIEIAFSDTQTVQFERSVVYHTLSIPKKDTIGKTIFLKKQKLTLCCTWHTRKMPKGFGSS